MFLQETDLNVVPGGIIPVMHVSQYDVGRELKFVLYDGYDTADITTGTTVTIEGTKPDGHGFQYSGVLDQNAHTATFVTTEQMTVLAGAIECKLTLYLNSQRIGTALFILDVEKAGLDENTDISETEIPLIIALAKEQMRTAEAYAVGTREGVPVTPDDPAYQNNAKYHAIVSGSCMRMAGEYAESANASMIASGSFMRIAGNYKDAAEAAAIVSGSCMRIAGNFKDEAEAAAIVSGSCMRMAGISEQNAALSAQDAEAYAIGKRNGQDVPSTDPAYNNSAKHWAEVAQSAAVGGINPQGSCTFANLPSVSTAHTGDMWNITDAFTTTSDFVEGAGHKHNAGANVYLVSSGKWDVYEGEAVSDTQEIIAPVEGSTSAHAYGEGEQFIYNDLLYTATSAISIGDTITPGTNCTTSDTIVEQLANGGSGGMGGDIEEMFLNNSFYAVITDDNGDRLTDDSGNKIVGDWSYLIL